MATTRAERPLRFLALGDSYTIGEGVDRAAGWPAQLRARLQEQAIDVDAAEIVATTGWTTDELQQAIAARTFTPPYALVSLLIGVNNQYRGRSVDDYLEEFAALLQRAIALTRQRAARVLVLSIPDWGVTPFARRELRSPCRIAQELDAYNAAASELCSAEGVAFVDITAISRTGEITDMLAADGLHPSALQYARWAEAALPVARRLLAAP